MITRIGYSQLKSLPVKQPCYVATTANIANLYSGAPDLVDGVFLLVGSRVLVKNQLVSSENGIYIVDSVGGGNDGSWVRSIDGSIDEDYLQGTQIYVSAGNQNGGKIFVLDTIDPIQLNTTGLTFSLFTSGGGDAKNGLEIVSGDYYLGGSLLQNTTINADGYVFTIGAADILLFTSSIFDVEADGLISLDAGTGSVQILGDETITIAASGSADLITNGLLNLVFSTSSVIDSSGASAGLVYAYDYSSGFVDNSLVTKKYVDSLTFSGGGGGGSSSLKVVDYSSGQTYSDITTMIFRGGNITTPSGTNTGVSVEGSTPTVTIWIPAATYVGYFNPTLSTGTPRYISEPSLNTYNGSGGNSGQFGVGSWSQSSDFSSSSTRTTINSASALTAFTETEFACFNTGTTMSFTLYNHDNTVLYSIQNYIINGAGSTTSNGLTITVNSFSADNDRYKANVSGTINIPTIFPNGGRFKWNITHFNGDGAGNAGAGIYSFTSGDFFYDNDGSSSSANISGGVQFDELVPLTVTYSGVSFYDSGSTFALTSSGINLLNDLTFPTTKQIDFSFTNLATTGTLDGYADGSKGDGSVITGWSIFWNNSGLTYSRTSTVNQVSQYIPGYSTNNTISSTPASYVRSTIYDWGSVGFSQSSSKSMLFDTYSPSSVTYNNNPLDSESERLSSFGVLTNGSSAYNSSQSIVSTDDLQYIFGRVIYPQTNFTNFYPTVNLSSSINYSSLTGSNRSFTVVLDNTLTTPTTTSVSFNDYRWHVTSYGKDASYLTTFSNGTFTLNSNFVENDLDYDIVDNVSGTGDLVLLIGYDSTSSNSTPNRFIYLTGNPTTYNGRTNGVTNNLDNSTESSKTIQFNKGLDSTTIRKVWLFIGYKNSTRGKNLRITNIALA